MDPENSSPQKGNRCMRRFKVQPMALHGAFMLMFSSGIYMNRGFFNGESVSEPWMKYSSLAASSASTWFVGGIIGFLVAPVSLDFLSKKNVFVSWSLKIKRKLIEFYFQFFSNILIAASAIFLIIQPNLIYTVFLARFIGGIGHGLCYVAAIQYLGEISDDNIRGRFGTLLHLFLLKGGIISTPLAINLMSFGMDANRFLGINIVQFSLSAILLIFLFYKESPVTLIAAGKDESALKMLMILKGKDEETDEITKSFNDAKAMVLEDRKKDSGIFTDGNVRPLLIVILLRLSFVLSFNFVLKQLHFHYLHEASPDFNYNFISNTLHTLTTVIVLFTIDSGKRLHFLFSAVGTSLTLIFVGMAFAFDLNFIFKIILFLSFEIFSAIGLGLTAHIYSAEAFCLSKQTRSIAFTAIVENITQIALIFFPPQHSSSFDLIFIITSGSCLLLIAIYLYFELPETKHNSILEAQKKFKW